MFHSVVEEIEERQNHLEDLGEDCDRNIATRIKNEIVERIGELQKIRDLQSKGL